MKNLKPERYGPYILRCPQCKRTVHTVPAEGVPDQSLRGCPVCMAVFTIRSAEEAESRELAGGAQVYTQQTVSASIGGVMVTITVTHPAPIPASALPAINIEVYSDDVDHHMAAVSPEVRS